MPGAGQAARDALSAFQAYEQPRDGLGENPFTLGCSFEDPATPAEMVAAWPSAPDDVRGVWSVSRESRLLVDVDYGQWGLVLLSPAAAADRTRRERVSRPGEFRDGDLVVGEFLGDSDVLVRAPAEHATRGLLVALPLDGREDWYPVGPDLGAFLGRYLAHAGDKFWERPSG